MKSSGEHQDLIQQLAEHLRLSGVAGLPREWFESPSPTETEAVENLIEAPVLAVQAESGDPVASPLPIRVPAELVRPVSEKRPLRVPADVAPSQTPSQIPSLEGAERELAQLRETAESCTRCRLCETRNKVVFGVGNVRQPLIAFVGEGPGADEDRTGEPFVGKAGQLLTAAITKGLGLRREDVYICNVVKCRPPENRAPLPDETASCTPYLYRQLELINPQVIITLGQPAQKALSNIDMGITKLRGKWQEWRGFPLMPTFHPAYILRNPPAKKEFWEDLQEVMRKLGLPALK